MKKANFADISTLRYCVAAILIVLICAISELTVFQNHLWFAARQKEEQSLSLEDVILSGCEYSDGKITVPAGKACSVVFKDCAVETVCVTVATETDVSKEFYVDIAVGIADEANSKSYLNVQKFMIVPGGENNVRTVRCESGGKLSELRLNLGASGQQYSITGVTLNSHSQPIEFSFFRFTALSLLGIFFLAAYRNGWLKMKYDPENKRHNLIYALAALFCIGFCITVRLNADIMHGNNIYVKFFEAIMEGRIYLSEAPEELAELINPYDNSLRKAHAISYLWDCVYYNGKYYVYFGIAPIAVYGLIYMLTGVIASDSAIMAVVHTAFIVFLFLAIRELMRTFKLKVNFILFTLCSIAAAFATFLFALQGMPSFYTLAPTCASLGTAAMVYFSYAAENRERSAKKNMCYILAGISLVFVAASRPNICLMPIAFCLPLYIRRLANKKSSLKARIANAVSFAVPCLIGAFALMYYNYVRFASPIDFGAWYQLTAYDTSFYKFELNFHNAFYAIYHYFFQIPDISPEFPFLVYTGTGNVAEGMYKYFNWDYAGVLAMPINVVGLLLLRLKRKKSDPDNQTRVLWNTVIICVLLSTVFMAIFDYCMAGCNLRYVVDISVAMAFLSMLSIFGYLQEHNGNALLVKVICIACVLTVFAGTMFVFRNADNIWIKNNPDTYVSVADWFMGITK